MGRSALEGITVLDLSRILAGPYCAMLLGDQGADVIKIEQPGVGDGTRQWGPPYANGESAYYLCANRNKRSVTLNLKRSEGVSILLELVKRADILVENFKVGTTSRLGIDFESLARVNSRLIYCSISGYGQTGPYRNRSSYDFMIQAQGGLMSITGPADGEPYKVGVPVADLMAGLFASSSILSALYSRTQTGRGQYIDLSLLDSQIASLANVAQNFFVSGDCPGRYGNAHPNIVPYEAFPTSDGSIALAVGNDKQFARLCELIGRPELVLDQRFGTNSARVENREALLCELREEFQTKSTSTWMDRLVPAGVPAAPVNNIPAALQDPQVVSRDMVREVLHPLAGQIKLVGPVAKMSETPQQISRHPPLLGADTDDVLIKELGLSKKKVIELRKRRVV